MALVDIGTLEGLSPIFRGKVGNAFGKFAMRVLEVDRCNEGYDRIKDHRGVDFARAFLEEVGASYSINGLDPSAAASAIELPEGPFITVSNHPIGSVDGIILADFFGHLRGDYKLMVNKVLMMLEAFTPCLIPVTPTGTERTAPTADSISGVRGALQHLRDGHPLGLFPAGAVSNKYLGKSPEQEPKVRDREWQMPIIKFIQKAGVPVVPVRFFDGNSQFFYNLGLIDWRVRLLRQPHEVFNKAGQTIRLGIGPIITPAQQAACRTLDDLRTLLRAAVYSQQAVGEH